MPERRAQDTEVPKGDLLELELRGKSQFSGSIFTGWESMVLTRNLNAAAGSFELEVSGRLPWPIKPSDELTIRLAGVQVMTGQVDAIAADSSATQLRMRVSGRDKTAQLIDCSALNDPGEWFGLELEEIAQQIAEPFGITVRDIDGSYGQVPFEHFKLQPGESAWNAIERACRLRAKLAFVDGEGRLIISKPSVGVAAADLIEGRITEGDSFRTGRPIISTAVRYTHADRFNLYVVRGQGSGSDEGWGESIAVVEGSAFDEELPEQRKLLILAEGQVTFDSAEDRAQWEATQRAARSANVTVVVQDWRQEPGELDSRIWQVNESVNLRVPSLQLDTELLVEQVTFTRNLKDGTRTTLRLVRRDAYKPQPTVPESAQPFEDLLGGADEFEDDF